MSPTGLLRLYSLTGDKSWLDKAEKTIELFRGLMASSPLAAGQMLVALDFHLGPVQEFAVVGDPSGAETKQVLRSIFGAFRPNKVVALKSTAGGPDADGIIALVEGKPSRGA